MIQLSQKEIQMVSGQGAEEFSGFLQGIQDGVAVGAFVIGVVAAFTFMRDTHFGVQYWFKEKTN